MHKIKSITVEGFRGQRKTIRLNLHESANFLIGRNGTGKTTLINLINAALGADIGGLREIRFDSIEVVFRLPETDERRKCESLGRSPTPSKI